MFFSKTLAAAIAVCLSVSLQASAHAVISPALGLTAPPIRADAQRPKAATPCGKASLAAFDTSGTITPSADGTFTATITSFNLGVDGSRQVTAQIAPDGSGQGFVEAQVLQNGDRRVTSKTSQQLVIQMPAGMKCTGGVSGTKCLATFKSASGFGNCVVIDQGGAAAASGTAVATAAATSGTAASGTATGAAASGTDATGDDTTGDATDASDANDADDSAVAAPATSATAATKGIKRFFESQRESRAFGSRAPRMVRRRTAERPVA